MQIDKKELEKYKKDLKGFLQDIDGKANAIILNSPVEVYVTSAPENSAVWTADQKEWDSLRYDKGKAEFLRGMVVAYPKSIDEISEDNAVSVQMTIPPYTVDYIEVEVGVGNDTLIIKGRTIDPVGVGPVGISDNPQEDFEYVFGFYEKKLKPAADKHEFKIEKQWEELVLLENKQWKTLK